MFRSIFGRRSNYLNIKTIDEVQSLCRSVEKQISQVEFHEELLQLFQQLSTRSINQSPQDFLRQYWNFSLRKDRSQAHNQGVFLDYGRISTAGKIVAIYPGTIYHRAYDPLLLPSIRNQFLLARKDDFIIDGRDRGLSRSIYLSCHSRSPRYDKTWLSQDVYLHQNPLTLGHYVNHFPEDALPNVTYYELDFAFHGKLSHLERFIPHVRYADIDDHDQSMPSTVLVSLRPIEKDEELFSCYLNLITKD